MRVDTSAPMGMPTDPASEENAQTGETAATGAALTLSRDYFDALYDESSDPWRIAGNWYEYRKRSLLLAMLPRRRFSYGFEPGCGSGELTLELGYRCDHLLAADFSKAAVDITRERWQQAGILRRTDCAARFACMAVPADWPVRLGAAFDLIVISELGYYLDAAAVQKMALLADASLAPDGVLLACHWKRDFDARLQPTQAVHDAFHRLGSLHGCGHYEDADFLLDVWSRDTLSVAEQENLT